jgi:hypothetical protein
MNKIEYWQSKFRILKGWSIVTEEGEEYRGQVHLNADNRKAYVCPWESEEEPEDYILHEILHICMIEIEKGETHKERRRAEELFVRDLCTIIYDEETKLT